MERKRLNKRGLDTLMSTLIYVLFVLIFFSIAFYFVHDVSTGANLYGKLYAAKFALALDSSEPGMFIKFDVQKLLQFLDESNRNILEVVYIDKENNVVVEITPKIKHSRKILAGNNFERGFNEDTNQLWFNVTKKGGTRESVFEKDEVDGGVVLDNFVPESWENSDLMIAINYAKDNFIENNESVKKRCKCGDNCEDYASYIKKYSQGYDELLILSLMMQETNCVQSSHSSAGCVGLMQVCSWQSCQGLFSEMDKDNWKTILIQNDANIQCGVEILDEKYFIFSDGKSDNLFKNFENECGVYYSDNLHRALRGYAGVSCDVAHKNYVENVLAIYYKLKEVVETEKKGGGNA